MDLVHHHLLLQGRCGEGFCVQSQQQLEGHLGDVVDFLQMDILLEPRVVFVQNDGWTGLVAIKTSHLSFHYWLDSGLLQFDIYSCCSYDRLRAIEFLKNFWQLEEYHLLFVDRGVGEDFQIKRFSSSGS